MRWTAISMMRIRMNEHLWAFSLLLILCHNHICHHKERVFVLKRIREKKKKNLINNFFFFWDKHNSSFRSQLPPVRVRCSPPRPRPPVRPRAAASGPHLSPWWWRSSQPGPTPGTSCSTTSWCCKMTTAHRNVFVWSRRRN